jgi:hypothetical protein
MMHMSRIESDDYAGPTLAARRGPGLKLEYLSYILFE